MVLVSNHLPKTVFLSFGSDFDNFSMSSMETKSVPKEAFNLSNSTYKARDS